MTRLSVNINKIALIRNSRGEDQPNLFKVAQDCEAFGADGITVHPRPDQRHVRYSDIAKLRRVVTTEFNIEGYPNEAFIKLVLDNGPEQVTLVPDPPDVLTSNAGWDLEKSGKFLMPVIQKFRDQGIRVSLFVEADEESVILANEQGADRIELYTGPYAKQYEFNRAMAIEKYSAAAKTARLKGIGINAGHDLNLDNLQYFKQHVDQLLEVSIGHALIIDSIYFGLKNVINMYKNLIK